MSSGSYRYPASPEREERFWSGAEDATRFFMGAADVHKALEKLADVLELVRAASLPRELTDDLDPSVRGKYLELWDAAQSATDE